MSNSPSSISVTKGFVWALRQRTAELHSRAERTGIVARLLRGQATVPGYALMLRNLLPAYLQMEMALSRMPQGHPFSGIARREVFRASALQSDLRQLVGPGWSKRLPIMASARRYAGLVQRAGSMLDGGHLVAHAYVRYLGDLSGGQILRRLLGRSLGLDESALSFYQFSADVEFDQLKSDYRSAIDAAGFKMHDMPSVLEEAAAAFEANIEISEAVERYVSDRPDFIRPVPRSPSHGR